MTQTTQPEPIGDALDWVEQRLAIVDKSGKLGLLQLNQTQQTLVRVVREQRDRGLPIRILVLKSRQQGISTVIEAMFFTEVVSQQHFHAAVIAHDKKASRHIFAMARLFHAYLPAWEQRPQDRSSVMELAYSEPHGSRFSVLTAGQDEVGRAETAQLIHGSEVAFWPHDTEVMTGLMQIVGDRPETGVILESTANGMGGEFHARWEAAEARMRADPEDWDGFVPVFFSWLLDPDCSRAVPVGYEWGRLDADEVQLRDEMGATDEQLYWRRYKIRETFNDDTPLFCQEYPATPAEAFMATGRPAIPAIVINHHTATILPEVEDYEHVGQGYRRCNLVWDSHCPNLVRPQFGRHITEPCWRIWRVPGERADYAVGADVAEGIVCDPTDPRSEPDWSTAFIMDREALMQVAEYRGRIEAHLFGEELVKAALWYNRAWLAPESNAAGQAVVGKLKESGYSRIYRRMEATDKARTQFAEVYGFRTTPANRKEIIDRYLEYAMPDLFGSFEGRFLVRSDRFLDEETTFVWHKSGRRQHRDGYHDDLLFAAFLALQAHLNCPRTVGSAPARHDRPVELNYIDAVDPGIEFRAYRGVERTR